MKCRSCRIPSVSAQFENGLFGCSRRPQTRFMVIGRSAWRVTKPITNVYFKWNQKQTINMPKWSGKIQIWSWISIDRYEYGSRVWFDTFAGWGRNGYLNIVSSYDIGFLKDILSAYWVWETNKCNSCCSAWYTRGVVEEASPVCGLNVPSISELRMMIRGWI